MKSKRILAVLLIAATLLVGVVAKAVVPGIFFLMSAAMHTAVIAGLIYESTRQAETTPGGVVWIDTQVGQNYTPPVPPPPAEKLPVLKEPQYKTYNMSTGATTPSASSTTLAGALEELNRQLSNTVNANQPWYGKIQAVAVVKNATGTSPGTPATQEDSGTTTFQVVYRVDVDFTLNPCKKYTAGATFHTNSRGTSNAAEVNNSCIYNSNREVTYNEGAALTISNAYYSAGSGLLPFSIQYTAATCNSGYSYNPATQECVLSNKAIVSSGPDKICPITWGGDASYNINPFDPDCALVQSSGAVVLSNSNKTVTVKTVEPGAPGRVNTQTATRRPDGGTDHNLETQEPSGLTQNTARSIDPAGKVDKETPKQPTYKPVGSTGAPTALQPTYTYPSPGTAPVQCGGEGMPPCKVEGAGIPADVIVKEPEEGGEEFNGDDIIPASQREKMEQGCRDCEVGAQDMLSWFKGFLDFDLGGPSYTCSAAMSEYSKKATVFETGTIDFDANDICEVFTPHEATIKNVFQFIWAMTALFILISS